MVIFHAIGGGEGSTGGQVPSAFIQGHLRHMFNKSDEKGGDGCTIQRPADNVRKKFNIENKTIFNAVTK